MKVTFKTLGFKLTVECESGATCNDAIVRFIEASGKTLDGMDFFANGSKITDLDSEAPTEILAIKSKHESAF